ncbi:hypothetical protein [Polaribacter sp.]|uniref:hypothetical protein n=1 Tax=Polaribacter sp. TaxID=1920175 RepID=UPI003F6BAA48
MAKKFVRVKPKSTKIIDYTSKVKKDFMISSSNLELCFLIFSVNEMLDKYKLTHEEVLIILYLYELGLFTIYVDINRGTEYSLNPFLKKGLIEQDYSNNDKKLFKLSDIGVDLVKNIFYNLENSEVFKNRNREISLELESKAVNLINKYIG